MTIRAVCAFLLLGAAACSFPEVTFAPLIDEEAGASDATTDSPTGSDSAAGGQDGGSDATTLDVDARAPDAASDAPVDATNVDATNVDAADGSVTTDANGNDASDANASDATDSSADANDGDPCDKDRDTYKAQGGSCLGNDCDDNDDRRNPGVTNYRTYQDGTGDWNCVNGVEKQYPVNVNCSSHVIVGNCNATFGFTGDPACGTMAAYVTCAWDTLSLGCKVGTSGSQTQGCK